MESQRVRHNLATKNNKEFSCLCIAQQSPLKVSCRRPKREGSGHNQLNTGSPPSAGPTCAALGLSPSHHPRWQSQIRLADTRSTPGQRGTKRLQRWSPRNKIQKVKPPTPAKPPRAQTSPSFQVSLGGFAQLLLLTLQEQLTHTA